MKKQIAGLIMMMIAVVTTSATAQDTIEVSNVVKNRSSIFSFAQNKESTVKLDLPLFDLPYQIDAMNTVGHGFFSSYSNPSMAQSLAVTVDIYSGFHYGMGKLYDKSNMKPVLKNIIFFGGTVLGDVFLGALPPIKCMTWTHEEYHRAVMSRYGVNSFNAAVYTFKSVIGGPVTRITDENLERFKRESPADFIRMHAAGFEAENLSLYNMQKNNFFYINKEKYFSELDLVPFHWITLIAQHSYIMNKESDWLEVEPTIAEREVNGGDPISWVYDLFRPDEPYSARGVHSTGVGINRYRKFDDLTEHEQKYFKKVGYWQFASYISPMLFGFSNLPFGKSDMRWNFAFRHFLTSFGTDLSFNFFLKADKYNLVFNYHSYQNYANYFPAIEVEMIDFPINRNNFGMYLSPRIALGIQPKDQVFFTSEKDFFGLIGSRFDFRVAKNWFPYFEIVAKTKGWVAGNEYLGKNVSCRMGLSARF